MPLPPIRATLLLTTCAVLWLGACATRSDITRVGSGGGPAVYEMRGRLLSELRDQAGQLCGQGFVSLREWERLRPGDRQAGHVLREWTQAADFFAPVSAGQEAQLLVQCKA